MAEEVDTLEIRKVLIEGLGLEGMTPEMIDEDEPLFEGGLGLDSVDALEIVVALEQRYDIRIRGHDVPRESFQNVNSLRQLVNNLIQDESST